MPFSVDYLSALRDSEQDEYEVLGLKTIPNVTFL